MEFSSNIVSTFQEIYQETGNNCAKHFVEDFTIHYELLKEYSPTYTFVDTHEEPNNALAAIEWIPSRMGFMLYSTNYRVIELMEDFVESLNKQHYLSVIVLSRALMEYVANINYHVQLLMKPTEGIMKLNKKGRTIGTKNVEKNAYELAKQVINARDVVMSFLASSRPHFDETKRTEMEKWQHKFKFISPGPSKLMRKMPKEHFNNTDPFDHYHLLCNYSHPNSESNKLTIIEAQESELGTQFTLSRDQKSHIVLFNFLNIICIPVLGALKTFTISLNQINEILKVYKLLYQLPVIDKK